jgi:hypothetical protein
MKVYSRILNYYFLDTPYQRRFLKTSLYVFTLLPFLIVSASRINNVNTQGIIHVNQVLFLADGTYLNFTEHI